MSKSQGYPEKKVSEDEAEKYLRPALQLKHYWYLYCLPFIKYFSLKKLANLLLNLYEYKTKRIYLKSVPWVIYIDPVNACILHCPLCPTGRNDSRQEKATMKFTDFKKIIDKIKPYPFFIYLYKWGEPFLNKEIFRMVDYCHQNKIGVLMHSNLNFYDEEILKNIVSSKIDYLSVSIDGFTQKNYSFYRRRGNIKKVKKALEKIIYWRKKLKSPYPKIVWQLLLNNRNIGERKLAEDYAKKIGVDVFESRPLFLDMETKLRNDYKDYKKYLSRVCSYKEASYSSNPHHCRYLWIGLTVNPRGYLAPCCAVYADNDNFGNIFNGELKDIINSEIFTESRKLFTKRNYQPKRYTVCQSCQWYNKA